MTDTGESTLNIYGATATSAGFGRLPQRGRRGSSGQIGGEYFCVQDVWVEFGWADGGPLTTVATAENTTVASTAGRDYL